MRWEDLDLDKAEWTIPKEETKAGRVHDVPLSKQAVEILRGLPRFEGGPYVFTTTSVQKTRQRIFQSEKVSRRGNS